MKDFQLSSVVTPEPELAEEYAVAFCINDVSYAVMMASPHDLDDFAFGFLFAEQLISNTNQVHDIRVTTMPDKGMVEINITLANRCLSILRDKKRRLTGVSGCGVCGVEALQQALPDVTPVEQANIIALDSLAQLRDCCQQWQALAKSTGAMHGAFLIDLEGNITAAREDIGRHNALDKLIGSCVRDAAFVPENHAILLTSRCGVELVYKVANIGIANLVSLSAPSQLALSIAQQANVNLIHLTKLDGPRVLNQAQTLTLAKGHLHE
ncbi:formate dehydrogenase accessory sulfurtransferase FdhD [Echinimonas agarilytica]|uniref:Sulfur carrier protein FdhD n=1 Tax=Echinimonas agarilytica TaxID=1215918 RepID=A0AA42B8T7_9GAMM|nr:formate dehydrogenase accessory sulfurtransferase FdhD [Echinimonas agarilytica]